MNINIKKVIKSKGKKISEQSNLFMIHMRTFGLRNVSTEINLLLCAIIDVVKSSKV